MNDKFDIYELSRRARGSIDPAPNKRQSDYYTRPAKTRSRMLNAAIMLAVVICTVSALHAIGI